MLEETNSDKSGLKVAVGMSGGLDSSVVAGLMKESGYQVMGLTLHLFKEGSRCCSLDDIERARKVCEYLGIRHYSVNAVELFEEAIINPFVEGYASGITPSPCVLCNQRIKFGALLDRARQVGCTHVATGHYVRKEKKAGSWHLYRAVDPDKDQSYFLHRLSQNQLEHSLFPLEGWTKEEVRRYAEERGLPVATSGKAESQDLCFITEAGPAPFVERYHPELRRPGRIVDDDGRDLGGHDGFHRFTVGQRKGLGVASTSPLYVKRLDENSNTVVVARRSGVVSESCLVKDMHWVSGYPEDGDDLYTVRVRYRHPGSDARIELENECSVRVYFTEPQFAVAPGQAAVIYRGDEILGGGWIAKE